MRFAEMVKVFSPWRRNGLSLVRLLACLALIAALDLVAPGRCLAQTRPTAPAAEKKVAAGQTKNEAAKAGDDAAAKGEKKADADAPADVPDPSQTRKEVPIEIFKDPNAEEILDPKKFNPIRSRAASKSDIDAVKTMASDPNTPVDPTVIRRVVDGLVAQLTDTKNIQALIDPPPGQTPGSPVTRAIQEATADLLEPVITARESKSTRFQAEYNRVLVQKLQPLLKHHLVPRVQAMIVLGQSGNPDALKLYLDEIKNPDQTVWVKLWAFRGISNIKKYQPNRLTAAAEIEAARLIADQLDKHKEWPWPVQLRATEALSSLRQGFVPSAPKEAKMAETAMRILVDPQAKTEVRAEAARALGMMQITQAVPNFNYALVAFAAGQLAAQLGDQIAANYSDKGTALNAIKAEYLASLLLGPLYQTFEGAQGVRESGLLHNTNAGAARAEAQKVLDAIKPVARAAVDLLRSPTGLLKARRLDLTARVAALKDFLAKNAPENNHLVPQDDGFPVASGEPAQEARAEPAAAAKVAGARREK
jgi:hypothetical protein